MPEPLRAWYKLAGRRGRTLWRQNQLVAPSQLTADDRGRITFYEENQGVFVMATERSGRDPAVYSRLDRDPWAPLGMNLTEFLLQAVLLEALFTAPYCASIADLERAPVEALRAAMRPVRMTPWMIPEYPTTQIEARGDAIAMYMAQANIDDAPSWSVWLGARTEHGLAFARDVADEKWDEVAL